MTDQLVKRLPEAKLVANVTPWWWERYWATAPPKMLDALRIVRTLSWTQEATITISLTQIVLMFETPQGTDFSLLHNRLRSLRIFLDEMVPLPESSATDPVS